MDSPDVNPSLVEPSHPASAFREVCKDDSGYGTVTPSSAECTRMSSDISGNLSMRTPYLSDSLNNHMSSFCLSTPEVGPPLVKQREERFKPKLLFNLKKDSSLERTSSSSDSLTDSGIVIDRQLGIKLPTLHEVHQNDIHSLRGIGMACLKRQKAICDDTEWPISASHHYSRSISSPKLDSDTHLEELEKLAVAEEGRSPLMSVETPETCVIPTPRCAVSDPRDYSRSLVSMNQFNIFEINKENSNLCTPHVQTTAQDTKYTCTPVKGPKKLKRLSPEQAIIDRSSKTPEKCPSPLAGSKVMKRQYFESQKLGSPEKYQLLYPKLKPVTPPKKLKLTKQLSPNCKKKLLLEADVVERKTPNFIGREHIDFIKMLKWQQPAVPVILGYLSGEDLINVCRVSKCWNSICRNEKAAEKRLRKQSKENERRKENKLATKTCTKVKNRRVGSLQSTKRDHLSEIQNHQNIIPRPTSAKLRSPPVSPGKRRFKMFVKAASEDSTSQLRSCPRCSRPARVRDQWAVCNGQNCGYSFCSRCFAEKAPGALCCQKQLDAPSPSKHIQSRGGILSKKSKKNLRRL